MKQFLLRRRLWVLLVAMLVALGVLLLGWAAREHERIQIQELERLGTQAKVIEDNLARQLTAICLSLNAVQRDVPAWLASAQGRDEALHSLQALDSSMTTVRSFLVTDTQGVIVLSNRPELFGVVARERDYFQVPLKAPNPARLYVSQPFKSVLNNYLINFSRVLLDAQGQFSGVISAAIDPEDFGILLNSVRYADDMRVLLAHGDGKVFISQPESAPTLGQSLATLLPGAQADLAAASQPGQALALLRDGRLLVARTIAPAVLAMDKPLRVVISRDTGAVFAVWRADVRNLVLMFALLALLSVLGLRVFDRQRAQKIVAAKRLRLATEASGVGIWEFDLVSKRYYWDEAMFKLFGLNPASTNERKDDWQKLLSPQDLKRMRDATRATIKKGDAFDMTFQVVRPDGHMRQLRNRAALYADDQGVPRRLIGATEDVTERKQIEVDLRLAAVAFEATESMVITDAQANILRVNPAFIQLFGYSAEEVLGQNPRLLKSVRQDTATYADMWTQLQRYHRWQGEIWNRRKNGEEIPCLLSITAVCDEDGQVSHYLGMHSDITQRRAAEEEVKRMAFYDPLTQLPNRRLLADRLQQALSQAHRSGTVLALMYLDLDRFKPVNDNHGHAAGDQLLQVVAQRLHDGVRQSDTVARIGGDEFVLLLASLSNEEAAAHAAENIQRVLRQPIALAAGVTVHVSSSIGIALYPRHGATSEALSHAADVAMYSAKAAGRDCYVLYQPGMQAKADVTRNPSDILNE